MVEEAYPRMQQYDQEYIINAYLPALYMAKCIEKVLVDGEAPDTLKEAMQKAQVIDK